MNITRHCLFIFLTLPSLFSHSQIPDSSLQVSPQLPGNYYLKVSQKIKLINERLSKKSVKYLAKFQKQEKRIQQEIERLHPGSVTGVFSDANEKYHDFTKQIKSETADPTKILSGEYNPYIDSLGTSLSFLKQFNNIGDKVKEPLAGLNELQNKLQQSEKIKGFIAERKNQIKELIAKYTKIPGSLKKEYDKLSKTAYYYSEQLKEYKDMLKDPKKVEQKVLAILNKLPLFQKFMKENGQLASLFRINGNIDPAQSLTGLQTRSSVQEIIQQRIVSGGPNAGQILQQNIAQATDELNKLKDKVNKFGGGGSDIEMPDFKVNDQKAKTFLKRLEYTMDIQFAKTNNLLPASAEIGLGIGYKLNDKGIIGIGLSYKMGMGTIQHLLFTSLGIGLRNYVDWKIKKEFYVSGGYEMNWNSAFNNIEQLKNYNAWQRSALFGVSKKYKISKKVKGEMKLLYDFLAKAHMPVSEPVVFRLGYAL